MLKCNISKTAIDRAGNALAKEKFKTYEEWEAADKIFDEFRQAHLQPLTSTTIAIQNWFRADNASYIIVQRLKRKPQILKKLKYIKSRFKALSPSDGLSSTISGLKQINRIIKRIIKNG